MAKPWNIAAQARIAFADIIDSLSDKQLATQSLCSEWTVLDVAGHVTSLVELSIVQLGIGTVKNGMDSDGYLGAVAKDFSALGASALTYAIRSNPTQPLLGYPEASLVADTVVHIRDVERPLGLTSPLDPDALRMSLDYGSSEFAKRRKRKPSPRLVATDIDWSWGDGPEAHGTGESLLMALNRRAVHDELDGDGAPFFSPKTA